MEFRSVFFDKLSYKSDFWDDAMIFIIYWLSMLADFFLKPLKIALCQSPSHWLAVEPLEARAMQVIDHL